MFEAGNLNVDYSVLIDWEHGQFHNCIRNSSFNFFRANGEILSWHPTSAFAGGSIHTSNVFNGIGCYKIIGSGAAKSGEIVQTLNTIDIRENYILSFYYKLPTITDGNITISLENRVSSVILLHKIIATAETDWVRVACNITDDGTGLTDVDARNLQLRICANNFTGEAYLDAICLELTYSTTIPSSYAPFETFKPVVGTTNFVEGVTEIEADTTSYVDMTPFVSAEGVSGTFSTPESGALVINRGYLYLNNYHLGLSNKRFSSIYNPNAFLFNGPDQGNGKGNVCTGRRCIIIVTAFDGVNTITKPVFTGIIEIPTDYGLERKLQINLWGRSFLPLEKNKINFTRLNHFANLIQNGGFESFEHEIETSKITKASNWTNAFGNETVEVLAVNNDAFGLYAMRVTGHGVGNTWVSVYQDVRSVVDGSALTLNGTYNLSMFFAGTNLTLEDPQVRLRVVALSGSLAGTVMVESTSSAVYKNLKCAFSTNGDATIRVYLDFKPVAGKSYEFNFDNVSLTVAAESVSYGAGISYLLRELFKAVGFGEADLNLEDNFRLVELFQILNTAPLKDLAELLQVDRLFFIEDAYGRLNVKSFNTLKEQAAYTTLDLSRFEASQFKYTVQPAISKVTVESDPLMAHDTYGKRVATGSVSNAQISTDAGTRIRIENLDEVRVNQFTVGIVSADLINTNMLIVKKLQTAVSEERLDINVTDPNRLTFWDAIYSSNPVLSLGTRTPASAPVYGSGGTFLGIFDGGLSAANHQGILTRTKDLVDISSQGIALLAESGTSLANSNAVVVRADNVFSGVGIRATGATVSGFTVTSGKRRGVEINTRAFTIQAPTNLDAYGIGRDVFKVYTQDVGDDQYTNFLFKAPNSTTGVTIATLSDSVAYLGFNVFYNAAWNVITPISGDNVGSALRQTAYRNPITGVVSASLQMGLFRDGVWDWGCGVNSYRFFVHDRTFLVDNRDKNVIDSIVIEGGQKGLSIWDVTDTCINIHGTNNTGLQVSNCYWGLLISEPLSHGILVKKTSGSGGAITADTDNLNEPTDIPAIYGFNPTGISGNGLAGLFYGRVRISGNLEVQGTITKQGTGCLTLDLFCLDSVINMCDGMLLVLSGTISNILRCGNKPVAFVKPCDADMQKTIVGVLIAQPGMQTPEVSVNEIEKHFYQAFDNYCNKNNIHYSREVYIDQFRKDHAGNFVNFDNTFDTYTFTSEYTEAFLRWYATPENRDLLYAGVLGEYGTCLVDPQFGDIELGDLICTSSTVGHGRKVHEIEKVRALGCIIGKALSTRVVADGPGPIAIDIFKA